MKIILLIRKLGKRKVEKEEEVKSIKNRVII